MAEYYFRSGSNEFGPLTTSQLKKLAASGRLTADDKIRQGSGEWVRASSLPGLFHDRPRRSDEAINEMDVLTARPLAGNTESDDAPHAQRETAFEAQVTKHAEIWARGSSSHLASPRARERGRDQRTLAWARAVSALCYMSSVLALVLGAFSLFSAQNVACEILGGVCFLIATLALGCGCAIRLLADLSTQSLNQE